MTTRWLRGLLDAIFPACCEVCGAGLPVDRRGCLCAACLAAMPPPPPPLCERCGVPLGTARSARRCSSCLHRPPRFECARAAALYRPAGAGLNARSPLATAVQRLKYDGRWPVADTLGALLAERYPFPRSALIVPVPLHRTRLRERGFNQAVLLARRLARERGLAVACRALVRTRATHGQPGLSAAARRRNLAAAFALRAGADVRDRHVVLVDDVLTTGATADACATVLYAAGATRVDVFTVGRAP